MKKFLGYLIMVGGVWGFAWIVNWLQTPKQHDDWLFFPVLISFMAIECFGASLSEFWDYF